MVRQTLALSQRQTPGSAEKPGAWVDEAGLARACLVASSVTPLLLHVPGRVDEELLSGLGHGRGGIVEAPEQIRADVTKSSMATGDFTINHKAGII